MPSRPHLLYILATLLLLAWLPGCSQQSANGNTPSAKKRPQRDHLVVLEQVTRQAISTAHERTGSLRIRRKVSIYNQEPGQIESMPFYEGDTVKQGEVLVRLEDDLLRAELDKAQATSREARSNLKRVRNLAKRKAISDDELVRSQTALEVAEAEQRMLQKRLEHTLIRAPFDGVVSERNSEPGDVSAQYSHLLTLSDPDSLVIQLSLSELLLPHVKVGDPVQVVIDALGKRRFPGRVLRIHPQLDPLTRQGIIEVTLEPIPEGARAGQFARVTLQTAQVERLLVPFAAVRRDRDGEFVFRVDQDNRVQRTAVRSGIRIGDRIELLDGLQPGARIVSRGFLGLSDGQQVKPVAGDSS